jgi:hypothetical protein
MPQTAWIELADQLFASDKAVIGACNGRPCGGHMTMLERNGGERQRPVANPWALNLAAGAAAKHVRVRKGLAHLGQAFLNPDQPGIAEQKNELGGGAQAAGKWQRIPSGSGRPLTLLNSHGHWEFLSEM